MSASLVAKEADGHVLLAIESNIKDLLRAHEEAGASLGLQYIIGDSWLESPSPSAPLLEKQGMKEVARIQEYWRRDYPITDYCPQCGDICY